MQTPKPTLTSFLTISDFCKKHILIADDEPINLIVTSKMLFARNAEVSTACDGNEVMDLLNKGLHPDLILLDIKMPGLDGFSTIEKIKERYPHLVVLAYTAAILDEITERLLKQKGFHGSLAKSYTPADFYKRIFEVLQATANYTSQG